MGLLQEMPELGPEMQKMLGVQEVPLLGLWILSGLGFPLVKTLPRRALSFPEQAQGNGSNSSCTKLPAQCFQPQWCGAPNAPDASSPGAAHAPSAASVSSPGASNASSPG